MHDIHTDFGDVLLWSFWIFIWIAAIFVWFRCVFDMFSDRTLSGWAKAGWAVLLIFLPWLGALIYLISRGRSMAERREQAFSEQQQAQRQYIQEVAGGGKSPAEELASAKGLLDSGAITQEEFATLKAKILA
jgi:hypothetical protein